MKQLTDNCGKHTGKKRQHDIKLRVHENRGKVIMTLLTLHVIIL